MKKTVILSLIFPVVLSLGNKTDASDKILGKWFRMSQMGPISLTFMENGEVTGDFGDDGTVEITSRWKREGRNIVFRDKSGVECPGEGVYRFNQGGSWLSFDYVSDDCGGRVQSIMGFFVREDYRERLDALSSKIEKEPSLKACLERGRMYLALGKSAEARSDFDSCIEFDPGVALYYVHRAGTRFPADMEGIVEDCGRAIELDGEENKNAYFLRGLAYYQLGEKEKACDDFYTAIELGFSILKEAEKDKCAGYWESLLQEQD